MTLQSQATHDEEIGALAPWFHNLHLPDGRETAPDHPLGDYPAFKWEQFAPTLPDDLSGEIPRHLFGGDAPDPGKLLAHDDGGIAIRAFVDPDPAAPGPEPVARPVMHVLVREVHLISQPAFYRVAPCQAGSN